MKALTIILTATHRTVWLSVAAVIIIAFGWLAIAQASQAAQVDPPAQECTQAAYVCDAVSNG